MHAAAFVKSAPVNDASYVTGRHSSLIFGYFNYFFPHVAFDVLKAETSLNPPYRPSSAYARATSLYGPTKIRRALAEHSNSCVRLA
jgi:hypothetical protein